MGNRQNILIFFTIGALLLIGSVFATAIIRQSSLDTSSQELALSVAQSALEGDSAEALLDRALNGEINNQPAADYQTRISQFQRLMGPIVSINTIAGSTTVPLNPWSEDRPNANYSVEMDFQRGSARLNIGMSYLAGQWFFHTFILSSERLGN